MCVGYPARVIGLPGAQVADVDVDGRHARVSLSVLDEPVDVGDWLLAHSGVALARLDPADAAQRIELFDAMRGTSR